MLRIPAVLFAVSLLAAPAAAQTFTLTVNVGGAADGTVAIIGPGGGRCSTPAVNQCTFEVPSGAAIRIAANTPVGMWPGRLSGGSGAAAGCALSTCGFTMNGPASVIATFTAGDGPIATLTTPLGGDGAGSVAADATLCQDFDPAQSSVCTSAYLQGSTATLSASPAAGSRFAGYSGGPCGAAASCGVVLPGNTSIAATFNRFIGLSVLPRLVQSEVGDPFTFTGFATYSDGVTEVLSPGPGTWIRQAPLPTPRYGLGAAATGSLLYAIGGIENGVPSGTVTRIDPTVSSPAWAAVPSMLVPREGFAVAVNGTTVYALGGNTPGGVTDTIDRLIPSAGEWNLIRAMRAPRRYFGATFFNQRIFVFGGETVTGGVPAVIGTVESARPPSDWEAPRAPMPTPRKAFAGVRVESIFYAIGGIDASGNTVATVEAYDLVTNQWSARQPMPVALAHSAAAVIDAVVYLVDGAGTTYQYDTQGDTWTVKSSLPTPRSELAAAAVNGVVYALGGLAGGTSPSTAVDAFTDTMRWGGPDAVAGRLTQQGVVTPPVPGAFDAFVAIGGADCSKVGGPCGTLSAPDPTRILGALDTPVHGSTISAPFLVQGWAIQRNASSGTCIDAVHVYADRPLSPPPGSPIFLGVATYGLARSDVAAIFGPQYLNSGFTLTSSVSLPAGPWAFSAYTHNACRGGFELASTMTSVATVATATTNPRMSIDAPAAGATVTSAFEIGGWAIDSGASSGTGVDAIRFYVQPAGAPAPGVFVGDGSYGIARPDVGAIFGSRFTNSGFHFTITGLGPGSYTLGAYAHSTVTGDYTIARTIPFTVDANQLMSIDVPSPEAVVSGPTFKVEGWSIDRAAGGGTGVDALHVYAFPDPADGRAPIFLGVASVGIARPDVAALYGAQYEPSGYSLVVDVAAAGLTPGSYKIAVHSHSTTGTFNAVAVMRLTLQ